MQALPFIFFLTLIRQYLDQVLNVTVRKVNRVTIVKAGGDDVVNQIQRLLSCLFHIVIRQQQPNQLRAISLLQTQ